MCLIKARVSIGERASEIKQTQNNIMRIIFFCVFFLSNSTPLFVRIL
jgi:hypothetical protein